jgi:hypothetical protein
LAAVPPALEEHPGMVDVRKEVMALLVKSIDERILEMNEEGLALRKRGVDTLATLLGAVHEMFEEASGHEEHQLLLRDEVKQLNSMAFFFLLSREALQLQLENDTYALLISWLNQAPQVNDDDGRASLFKFMVKVL